MRWLEVIKVRTVNHVGLALTHLNNAKVRLAGHSRLEYVGVFSGITSPYDVAIHLVWTDLGDVIVGGSESGQEIAAEMAKIGLVDHFIWRLRDEWHAAADGPAKVDAVPARREARA
jgi:hypothetical protein